MSAEPCDGCGESVPGPLARTVRLSVDRSNIDTQRLCPECFAEWVARYQNEMGGTIAGTGNRTAPEGVLGGDDDAETVDDATDIIVD